MTAPDAALTTTATRSPRQTAGLVMLHGVTAAWIGYGAAVKAIEFNPLLLPPPILKALQWFAQSTSVDGTAFLEWSLRTIVGVETFIVVALLFSRRFARPIAIAVMSLFCVILLTAMVQAGMKDGLKAAIAGSCGCFGKAGLPASVMLGVDGLLLASAIFLAPRGRTGGIAPLGAALVVGAITVFAIPQPTVEGGASNSTPPVAPVTTNDPAGTTPPAVASAWPDAPANYEKNYFPKWDEWIGKPFRSQKLALAIERPIPSDFERGDWLVVFSRADCDHCQAFYREHFAAPRKERVLKITIPDTTGTPLAMPCEGCDTRLLYRVRAGEKGTSPNYLIQTPVVLRLKDGVVTAVCKDVDKAEDVAKVLDAPATATQAQTAPAANAKPAVTAAPAWPGPPAKLNPFYVAEFGNIVGKPLADMAFARMIAAPVPADFLSGRWIVVFYREDCDHCHELLSTFFTGTLPVRTLLVAIPDADPNNLLDNPCDACAKTSLVKGPNYVIGTPVVLAIQDGVVECVVENAEDVPALEACLKFPKK